LYLVTSILDEEDHLWTWLGGKETEDPWKL